MSTRISRSKPQHGSDVLYHTGCSSGTMQNMQFLGLLVLMSLSDAAT